MTPRTPPSTPTAATTAPASATPGAIRAVLVDDEPLARKRLRALLAAHPRVQIVGEAANGEEACQIIESLRPDLVFLDIQMPGLSGFDVLAQLRERPRIIFVTAHDEFAVKAFDEQALDYLLKPVEPERLARALTRMGPGAAFAADAAATAATPDSATAAARAPATAAAATGAGSVSDAALVPLDTRLDRLLASIGPPKPLLRRIPVRRGVKIALVDVLSAAFFRAEDKYTVLYTSEAEHVIDRTIDELEQSLDPEQFLRIHRAAIVNVSFVAELTAVEGGRFLVALTDARHTRLVASRTGARTLRERLGL
jgi:two-component system LytT family response regulator